MILPTQSFRFSASAAFLSLSLSTTDLNRQIPHGKKQSQVRVHLSRSPVSPELSPVIYYHELAHTVLRAVSTLKSGAQRPQKALSKVVSRLEPMGVSWNPTRTGWNPHLFLFPLTLVMKNIVGARALHHWPLRTHTWPRNHGNGEEERYKLWTATTGPAAASCHGGGLADYQ